MQVLSLQEALQKEMNDKNSTKCLPEFISLKMSYVNSLLKRSLAFSLSHKKKLTYG